MINWLLGLLPAPDANTSKQHVSQRVEGVCFSLYSLSAAGAMIRRAAVVLGDQRAPGAVSYIQCRQSVKSVRSAMTIV